MAIGSKVKGITIEFKGDTTKLQRALSDVNEKSKGVDKQLKEVNRSLKFNPGNTELLAQKQTLLKQRVEQTKEKLEALKAAQAKLDDDPAVDKTSQEYMELRREIIETESKLKHFKQEAEKLNNVKLKALGDQLKSVGDKMKTVGKNATQYVSAPIAAGLGAAVKTTMDFDYAMSQVAATMGKTTQEMQEEKVTTDEFSGSLRDLAIEMGSKTAFSATQAAEALNYMALAGYDAKTSAEMLPKVLNLAAAGNMDLATASDMVTDSQSALGLSLEETDTLIDQMAKTSSKTNTSVEQLGSAILTVGGTAKTMKGGTEELASVLGVLADNGVKGSEGGTALRNILLSLQSPTDKAAATLEALGIQVFDAEGKMRDLRDIMPEMNAALSELTDEERTKAIASIFNKRDLKSVNALLATSTGRWDELSKAIGNSGGAAEEMAGTQLDNLKGSLTILKSALEGLAIHVGDVLTPYIKRFAEWITSLVDKFNELSPTAQTIITFIGIAVAAIGPLLVVAGVLLSCIGSIITALPMLGAGLTALAGPVGIVVAAIAGLIAVGVLLYKNWDKIKEKAGALKEWIVAKFNALKEGVKNIFAGIRDAMLAPIRKAVDTIKNLIEKIKNFFKFKVSLPHIKLPHFVIQPKGWKLGDLLQGDIPYLGIDWYANGAIFTKPTVVGNRGFGEAGAEAALPLDMLWNQMGGMFDRMAEQIVSGFITAMRMQGAGSDKDCIVEINLGGAKVAREIYKLNKQGKMIMEA